MPLAGPSSWGPCRCPAGWRGGGCRRRGVRSAGAGRARHWPRLAGWGLATARGGLGRLDGVEETLRQIDAQVESFEIGLHHAVVVVSVWLRGLLLAALLDRADQTARHYRERCQDTPGFGEVMT